MTAVTIIVIYALGFVVTQQIAYAIWCRDYQPEFEGFVWACLPALIWPLTALLLAGYEVTEIARGR